MDKQREENTVDDVHRGNKSAPKEVSGLWVLLVFVILLGAVLTLAAVTTGP